MNYAYQIKTPPTELTAIVASTSHTPQSQQKYWITVSDTEAATTNHITSDLSNLFNHEFHITSDLSNLSLNHEFQGNDCVAVGKWTRITYLSHCYKFFKLKIHSLSSLIMLAGSLSFLLIFFLFINIVKIIIVHFALMIINSPFRTDYWEESSTKARG